MTLFERYVDAFDRAVEGTEWTADHVERSTNPSAGTAYVYRERKGWDLTLNVEFGAKAPYLTFDWSGPASDDTGFAAVEGVEGADMIELVARAKERGCPLGDWLEEAKGLYARTLQEMDRAGSHG